MSVRSQVGGLASKVYPGLDERVWNRQRDRQFPSTRVRNSPPATLDRGVHVLVVPQEGPVFDSWRPGTGNF